MEPLTIVIPNHKADKALGGNSRASWQVKYRKLRQDKFDAANAIINQLNTLGITALEYLTNHDQYPIEDALPVQVTFKRFYTGKAMQWDDDNLSIAYKGFRDGISRVLGLNDKHFRAVVEQIRDDFNELEIEVRPAWLKGEEAA